MANEDAPMQMQITPSESGATLGVRFDGKLDTAGVDAVETRFLAATVADKDLLVDLGGVPLISSMGIRMLIGAARSMSQRRRRIVLFGAQELVAEVLETAAIDTLIATVETEAEARALVGA